MASERGAGRRLLSGRSRPNSSATPLGPQQEQQERARRHVIFVAEGKADRVANLMLTRYGEEAMLEGAQRAHELAADGDRAGAATWLRITAAIGQLGNTTATRAVH